MRKSFRFVLLIALPAMAVAASGLFVLGLATGLGSPGASPIELLWTIGRESFLADKLDQQCAEALERIWEREHIAHEVAEGRLGLAEAATRFAELNLELCPDALALQQAGEPGDPSELRNRLMVIHYVEKLLRGRREQTAVVRKLMDQVRKDDPANSGS